MRLALAYKYCTHFNVRQLRILKRCCSTNVPQQKLSYLHSIGRSPLVYRTVAEELDISVEKYGNQEAIVSCHEKKRLTFIELQDQVDRLAAGFIKIGLQPGDYLGIYAPNNIQWYLTMLAATRGGIISVGINPGFQSSELEYCIQKVGVKAIVAAESFRNTNYYKIFEELIPNLRTFQPGNIQSASLPTLKTIILNSKDNLPGSLKFDDVLGLVAHDEVQKIKNNIPFIQPDSPCNIQFTSGTTGKPKAAVLSHYNFVNNGIHIGNRTEIQNQRICVQVPLFHAFGVVITIMAGLSHGSTLVLPNASFNPAESLKAIVNEKCSVIHGTPTMYVDLIKKQKELNLPITTAKIAVTGGSPCSPKLFKDIKNTLGLEKVKTVFGMTESTAVIFQSLQDEKEDNILNTVGYIQDHIEAKVIDAEGRTVPFGHRGELCVRGYVTMLGYLNDFEKTKEVLDADKWLKTGDQFVLREDGYGQIVGRLKEMIIRGGENLFPKEIEDFLNTHPDIMESHVIGVPDERLGEELCAFVRFHDKTENVDEIKIREYCRGKIAHFKIPKYIKIVKDFPKTTSGKIQKFKLREIIEKTK